MMSPAEHHRSTSTWLGFQSYRLPNLYLGYQSHFQGSKSHRKQKALSTTLASCARDDCHTCATIRQLCANDLVKCCLASYLYTLRRNTQLLELAIHVLLGAQWASATMEEYVYLGLACDKQKLGLVFLQQFVSFIN